MFLAAYFSLKSLEKNQSRAYLLEGFAQVASDCQLRFSAGFHTALF
jgi:hypothetical protein